MNNNHINDAGEREGKNQTNRGSPAQAVRIGKEAVVKDDNRFDRIGETLAGMVAIPTVSGEGNEAEYHIAEYREYLAQAFPHLFGAAERTGIGEAMLLHLAGTGEDPAARGAGPVLFTGHMDVVPIADPDAWVHDPFGGEIIDGDVWGRGSQDMKGPHCALLSAIDTRLAEGWKPGRDLWLYFSCDEEIGGPTTVRAVQWLKERGIRLARVYDEGGTICRDFMGLIDGYAAVLGISEKGSLEYRFTARSDGGHAANPPKDSAIARLAALITEAETTELFPVRMIPGVREMLMGFARYAEGERQETMRRAAESTEDFTLMKECFPEVFALMRTTLAFTVIHGGTAFNVMPSEAVLTANVRVPSGTEVAEVEKVLRDLAARHDVELTFIGGRDSSRENTTGNPGYRDMEESVRRTFPDLPVTPFVLGGGTDSRFFEEIADEALRFSPLRARPEQGRGVHGNNESCSAEWLKEAAECYYELLGRL